MAARLSSRAAHRVLGAAVGGPTPLRSLGRSLLPGSVPLPDGVAEHATVRPVVPVLHARSLARDLGPGRARLRVSSPWFGPTAVAGDARGFLGTTSGGGEDVCELPRKHHERKLLGYSPQQLFDVVSNVSEYREFVPWCTRSDIVRKVTPVQVEAELEVGFMFFTESYTSHVTLEPAANAVSPHGVWRVRSTVSNSMLFHHLNSEWTFSPGPRPDTCWLTFEVDFQFRSLLYRQAVSLFFTEVVQQMIGAFEKRSATIYGGSKPVRA